MTTRAGCVRCPGTGERRELAAGNFFTRRCRLRQHRRAIGDSEAGDSPAVLGRPAAPGTAGRRRDSAGCVDGIFPSVPSCSCCEQCGGTCRRGICGAVGRSLHNRRWRRLAVRVGLTALSGRDGDLVVVVRHAWDGGDRTIQLVRLVTGGYPAAFVIRAIGCIAWMARGVFRLRPATATAGCRHAFVERTTMSVSPNETGGDPAIVGELARSKGADRAGSTGSHRSAPMVIVSSTVGEGSSLGCECLSLLQVLPTMRFDGTGRESSPLRR